ncbi:MAG: hypothetical protein [Caudoviricetes sp.]|nr:MAG: hypothetical protein [Caudoviricetes sp.]
MEQPIKQNKDYGFNSEPPCKIGDTIYVYEIYNGEIYYYADTVEFLGKDCVFTADRMLTDAGRTHYYEEVGEEWFLTSYECRQAAEEELLDMQEDVE